MMENCVISDKFIEIQIKSVEQQTAANKNMENLTREMADLRKELSNGVIGSLKRKINNLYFAIAAVFVPLVWILINILKKGT